MLTSVGVGAQATPAPDVARGRHIATALAGCAGCHGATFGGGRAFTVVTPTVDAANRIQTVYAANLTPGTGGVAALSDDDLRRAIRDGQRPDGTLLRVMPSSEYAVMTDADVADVIAFLRSLPPVDQVVPQAAGSSFRPCCGRPTYPEASPTGGAYLARIGGCTGCHGADLAGGPGAHPVVGPGFGPVAVPNISRDGIGNWSFADFQTAMRTGKTPDGRTLSSAMPWRTVGKMTDDELRAVYDFLESHGGGPTPPARSY